MRASKEMTTRLREILTRDKVGMKDGFRAILNKDANALFSEYFEMADEGDVKVEQNEDGLYTVSFIFSAVRIKSFESTADIKRY